MESKPRTRGRMGLGLLSLAVLFFFNPNIAVIDFLPDVLGYLLLYAALSRLADLQPHLSEARTGFLRLAFIDGCKLVSLVWLISMTSAKERPNAQLLLTFVFAVVGLIYAIPAWNHFFDGLFTLVSANGDLRRYDYRARKGKGGRSRKARPTISMFEKLKPATIGMLICREALAVLPELSSLSAFEYTGYVTNYDRDIYDFYELFVLMAFTLMLIIGVIWLCRTLRFTHRLRTDTQMITALRQRYADEVLPNTGLFTRRRLKAGLNLATLGAILTVDFYIEELNIIPDILAVAAFLAAVLVLRPLTANKKWILPLTVCCGWGVASLCSSAAAVYFHSEFYPELVYKNSEAYSRYQLMCMASVIEQIFFAGAVVSFAILLAALIQRFITVEGRNDTFTRAELSRKVVWLLVWGLLSAGASAVYDFLIPSVEFIWLIDFSFGLIFAGYVWKNFSEIYDTLAREIQLELPSVENERMDH